MNTIRDIIQINEEELKRGIAGTNASWHTKYQNSSWIYVGNLDTSITEGDIICVLSQYGEMDDIHLMRDTNTGISKGYAFCKYSDPRSCILAVDNFVGISICNRSLRIDHVENYRLPKHILEKEEDELGQEGEGEGEAGRLGTTMTKKTGPGHAYIGQELANEYSIEHGMDLFAPPSKQSSSSSSNKQLQMQPITTSTNYSAGNSNNGSSINDISIDKLKKKQKKTSKEERKHSKKETKSSKEKKKRRRKE
jgi:RNA-binding motif protein, X-linked 2